MRPCFVFCPRVVGNQRLISWGRASLVRNYLLLLRLWLCYKQKINGRKFWIDGSVQNARPHILHILLASFDKLAVTKIPLMIRPCSFLVHFPLESRFLRIYSNTIDSNSTASFFRPPINITRSWEAASYNWKSLMRWLTLSNSCSARVLARPIWKWLNSSTFLYFCLHNQLGIAERSGLCFFYCGQIFLCHCLA